MELLKIYSPSGELLFEDKVDDSSYRLREIMGDNRLDLRFSLPEYVDIVEGSYCDWMTERYWMPRALNYVKQHTEHFDYTLAMEGSIHFAKSTKLKFFDYIIENGLVKTTSAFKLKFPLTGTPQMFAALFIANLKLKYPEYPWTVGDMIESEPMTIDFNSDWCFDLLAKVSDKFETEWELDKYALHFRKVERVDGNGKKISFPLSYGYNNGILGGLKRIQYDNKKITNRVYVIGGERNVDLSKHGFETLLLEKNKRITHEGIEYTTDESGSYVERVTPLAGEEDSLDISKHYPKRVGEVSAVEVVNDAQGLYNFVDESIPEDLDFSKHIIGGETMTIIFQTGQVAGKEFDATYNHAQRKFLLKPIEVGGLIYPHGNLVPVVGDKYAVFHIAMPEQYVTAAQNDALKDTVTYLHDNEQGQYSYRWNLDGIFANRKWGEIRGFLNCGYFVEFSDPQFLPDPVDVRIIAVKEYINKPKSPEITIANNISSKTLGSVINEIPTLEEKVERKDREVQEYAKRRWKDTQELIDNIMGMTDEFKENLLSALVFEGMVFRAGAATLQYRFVADDWQTSIEPNIYFDKANKQLHCPASKIKHETLEVGGDKPHWNVAEYVSDHLIELTTPYYLYLKCSKELTLIDGRLTGEAIYFISTEKIKIEDQDGYYTLWVAFVNSENEENDRSFTTMYGLAELLPGQLTVDTIRSSDGGSYWRALKNQFKMGDGTNSIDWNVTEEHTLTMTNATVREALNVYGEAFIAGFLFSNQVIKSKATTGDLNAMVLDGLNGSLQFNNHTKRWTENGSEETKKQYIRLDSSNDARVEARNETDGDVAYLSSQGVFANRAGIDTLSATSGVSMKAAIAGLGFGKMDKDQWGVNYGIVGVFGTAANNSDNPAPAYGGWFNVLQANGLCLNTRRIVSDIELTRRDVYISCYNESNINVRVPSAPYQGQIIYIRRMRKEQVTIWSPSEIIHTGTEIRTWVNVGEGQGDCAMIVWDGQYWLYNYIAR